MSDFKKLKDVSDMNEKNNENVILSLKKIHDELNDYKLVIPDHQRPYDWRKKEWERLIRDIMNAYDDYKKGEQNSQIFLGIIYNAPQRVVGVVHLSVPEKKLFETIARDTLFPGMDQNLQQRIILRD